MPAKMASFCFCHSARDGRGDQHVLGAAEAQRGRHAAGRVERHDVVPRHGAEVLVVGLERPGAGVHEDERVHQFRARQHHRHDDPAAHGVAEEVDGAVAHRLEERAEVVGQLLDGVALEGARLGGVPVAPLVERDHAPMRRQRADLQREVVRRSRCTRGRAPGRASRRGRPPARTTPAPHR